MSHSPEIKELWATIDGAQMRYLRAGSGPALVLIHGLLGYSFSWRFNIPAFSPIASVYAPDLLGSGFSDRHGRIDASLRASAPNACGISLTKQVFHPAIFWEPPGEVRW